MEIVMKDIFATKAQHLQLLLMSPQMEENHVQLVIIAFLENNLLSLASQVRKMTKLSKVPAMIAQRVNIVQSLQ